MGVRWTNNALYEIFLYKNYNFICYRICKMVLEIKKLLLHLQHEKLIKELIRFIRANFS